MSRRQRRNRSSRLNGQTSDFTLSDYADAKDGRGRIKKRNQMSSPSADRNWDDDVDEEIDIVELEDEDGTKTYAITPAAERRGYVDDEPRSESPGVEYPIDVWFQISRYIPPEDVGRFARICRATLSITRSAHFWFHLYRKYIRNKRRFPSGLRPERMALRYGLRSCVIRCLHYNYAPFAIRENASNFYTPKTLLKRRCLSMWYEKPGDRWIFFFKLKPVDRPSHRSRRPCVVKRSVFDILDDVMANPEQNCKILRIQCGNFTDAPPVMGMILNEMFTKVASNMRYNNLNLGFSQGLQSVGKIQECTIILNHVFKMEVLNWWHPDYPHSSEFLPSSVISNSTKFINSTDF